MAVALIAQVQLKRVNLRPTKTKSSEQPEVQIRRLCKVFGLMQLGTAESRSISDRNCVEGILGVKYGIGRSFYKKLKKKLVTAKVIRSEPLSPSRNPDGRKQGGIQNAPHTNLVCRGRSLFGGLSPSIQDASVLSRNQTADLPTLSRPSWAEV
jgi:hypothetical protein